MTRSRRPCFRWASGPGLALCLVLAAGCVTRGTYREVVEERDQLRSQKQALDQRVELLEASNQSLGTERVQLIEQMEDLRQERAELDRNVRRLRKTEADLSENLRAREEALASREAEIAELRGTYEGLVSDLESEVAAGQIQIEQLRSGVRLNLTQDVLFASGEARLNQAGASVVSKVAKRLREIPHAVEVQGHTDNVPISTARFPSNWELAAARATEVVRLLAKQGVSPARLRAVSFGEYVPVASNDTPAGRAKNRRIEIRLEPVHEAPAKAPAASP